MGISEYSGELIFKVRMGERLMWVKRSFLVPDYLMEMVQFYETHINFVQ